MKGQKPKIIATIGDINNNGSREKLHEMIKAGIDVARFNFSYAKYSAIEKQIKWIREIALELRQKVYIMADLQGRKIRLGDIKGNSYKIKKGDELGFVYNIEHSGGSVLPIQFEFSKYIKPKQRIFISDGKIELEVIAVIGKIIKVIAKNDGYITSRSGVNLPDSSIEINSALTRKDLKDLGFIKNHNFDWVSLSYVNKANDINILRKILSKYKKHPKIIAKIETKTAINSKNLIEIVKSSDGVMVARGDMAYEIGIELVPVIQWKIIKLCHENNRFSIVATQMMKSMVDNQIPTNAEVSDIARAIFEGANYVMLSEETTIGKYPIETIKKMDRVIKLIWKNIKLDMK